MATHKPALPEPSFDFDVAYAQLAASMGSLHISRVAEMPRIELYLDQLLSLVDMELAFMRAPDERAVTGAMVNNYVKQRLVPAPTRKRYTRRHLASLLFVCAFKRVLSIAQIAQVRELCARSSVDVERAYDEVIGEFERAIAARFTEGPRDEGAAHAPHVELFDEDDNPVDGELAHLFETALSMLASKVYLEQLLALEARRARSEATSGARIM